MNVLSGIFRSEQPLQSYVCKKITISSIYLYFSSFYFPANFQCSNNIITVIEDEMVNMELQVTFTHFTPTIECNAKDDSRISYKHSTRVILKDPLKPYKAAITHTAVLYNASKDLNFINCSIVYHPNEELNLQDSIHFGLIPPFNIYDNFQPEFPFEDDKKSVECNFKINVQCL